MEKPDYAKDKNDAAEWARNLLKCPFIILDCETTGVSDTDEIVEITCIDQDGLLIYSKRVKPTIPIPAGASAVHHIFDADVANCPTAKDIWDVLRAGLSGTVVIYNAEFDVRLINQTADKYNLPHLNYTKVEDAMIWYSQFCGEWNYKYSNYRWKKLPEGDHTALGDVLATLRVIREMAEYGKEEPKQLESF